MGTFKEDNGNPVGCPWPVLNNSDLSYMKGLSSSSEISYFKGSSVDLGIIHQQEQHITENPQKAFIIKENELGFYLETFSISFQAIDKMKVFPLKNEVLDYLRNFKEKTNLCQGIKEELMFKNISNLFPGSFIIEKIDDGFIYKSRACLSLAEDENKKLCGACLKFFNAIEDDAKEVDLNQYSEVDSDDVDDGIKNDPTAYLKVDIKAEDDSKCDICGKMFSSKSKMNIHRNSVHSQEKQFACEFCPYRSARKDNLNAHRRKTHDMERNLESEDIANIIKNDPAEYLKVDIKTEEDQDCSKNDVDDVYFGNDNIPMKPKKKHFCKQCDAVFNTKKTLYRHNERCHSVKTENSEENAADNHRGPSRYSCDFCSAVFRYKRSFNKHMKQCHSVDVPMLPKKGTIRFKSIKCAHCEKAFSATLSYNKHLRDVHGEDVYVPEKRIMKKCPSCEQEFNVSKSSYKLVCHLRLIHHDEDLSNVIEELELGDEGRVVCQICGETKRNKYILASHIKTIHEESDELVPCHICGKLLRQNYGSMYSHLRSHSTDDYPCKYCGQIFKNKINARNHMKSHEPDFKKIECKECGVKFSRMIHLKKHRRYVHLKIKEAKCDICGKMFSTKSKMNIHRNSVHSHEKQFACEFCQYRSARKDNLNAHRKKTHGMERNVETLVSQMPQLTNFVKHPLVDQNGTSQRDDIKECVRDSFVDQNVTPQRDDVKEFVRDPHLEQHGVFQRDDMDRNVTPEIEDMKHYLKNTQMPGMEEMKEYLKDHH